jgi:hypothetical protein
MGLLIRIKERLHVFLRQGAIKHHDLIQGPFKVIALVARMRGIIILKMTNSE